MITMFATVMVSCTDDVHKNEQTEQPGEGEDEDDVDVNEGFSFINNSNTNPTMVAGGGVVNISFMTRHNWNITTNVDWLTTSKTSGTSGTVDFFITALANKIDQERKGVVAIVLDNGKSYNINVTQEPNEGIKHLVCQSNEILYTTKFNYELEIDYEEVTGFGEGNTRCVDYGYYEDYGYIRFSSDVTQIPEEAFAGCASLERIYLPDGVKKVGKNAFANCNALSAIISRYSEQYDYKSLIIDNCLYATIPEEKYITTTGVTKIAAGAFSGNQLIKEVIISEGVQEIEAGAFENCENLEYVEIPNSLTSFGGEIFIGNSEDLQIGLSETHPNYLLYKTSDNAPVDLNDYSNVLLTYYEDVGRVFYMEDYIPAIAFKECSTLVRVEIPKHINHIGEQAFSSCSSLREVYCKPKTPPTLHGDVFKNNAADRKIYVPYSSIDAYKKDTNWSEYSNYIFRSPSF